MKQKIETRLKLTGYYLEILTFETMKLLRSTKSNTKKDENGENVSNLVYQGSISTL